MSLLDAHKAINTLIIWNYITRRWDSWLESRIHLVNETLTVISRRQSNCTALLAQRM